MIAYKLGPGIMIISACGWALKSDFCFALFLRSFASWSPGSECSDQDKSYAVLVLLCFSVMLSLLLLDCKTRSRPFDE